MNGRRSFLYFKKNRGALDRSLGIAVMRTTPSYPSRSVQVPIFLSLSLSASLRGKRAMSVMLNTPPVKREIRFVMERRLTRCSANICASERGGRSPRRRHRPTSLNPLARSFAYTERFVSSLSGGDEMWTLFP